MQIIVCIDRGTGEVKLASVFRDTYLNLAAGSRFAKINEAYADGGPEQAVAALNKNLDWILNTMPPLTGEQWQM